METTGILYDFEPTTFVELCSDPRGVRLELVEFTGVRRRDVDELLADLRRVLATCFEQRPGLRRIVVWTDAAWLADHDADEYVTVRDWLDEGLRELQNPWRLPPTGQVGCAVLQGALPDAVRSLRVGERIDLGYERERPPERRSERRRRT
jgi:hypothetical protein